MARRYFTFYHHPTGMDGNGNYGPCPLDPGWTVYAIPLEEDDVLWTQDGPEYIEDLMIPHLPRHEQERIAAFIDRERSIQKCSQCGEARCRSASHLVADYAGWNVPWTLHSEGSWANELNNLS